MRVARVKMITTEKWNSIIIYKLETFIWFSIVPWGWCRNKPKHSTQNIQLSTVAYHACSKKKTYLCLTSKPLLFRLSSISCKPIYLDAGISTVSIVLPGLTDPTAMVMFLPRLLLARHKKKPGALCCCHWHPWQVTWLTQNVKSKWQLTKALHKEWWTTHTSGSRASLLQDAIKWGPQYCSTKGLQ